MRLLITGGCGFIGSNFVRFILNQDNHSIVNLDALTYAGNLENLRDIEDHPNYRFINGDICDSQLVHELFMKNKFDMVINFAAESHVDRSIDNPHVFLNTNIIGTNALLQEARAAWSEEPCNKYCRSYKDNVKFIQISTDEVYGDLGSSGKFTENTPLSPNSPYSVSKTSADLLVAAYHRTYGLPINITRCSNNYGPFQFPEKLIPLMINNCINNRVLPVYGDGQQIRDWLHVSDHCSAIQAVMDKGCIGEVYNIGGNNEKANIDIVNFIVTHMKADLNLIEYISDRPGHDRRYAIDNTKITTELGWKPSYRFEEGIIETIEWYCAHLDWISNVLSR